MITASIVYAKGLRPTLQRMIRNEVDDLEGLVISECFLNLNWLPAMHKRVFLRSLAEIIR